MPDRQDPTPRTWRWPDDETGPLLVRVWFGQVDRRPAVIGVEVWGAEPVSHPWSKRELPEARIGAQDVRLPLGRWLDEWTADRRWFAEEAKSPEFPARMAALFDAIPPRSVLRAEREKRRAQAWEKAASKRRRGRPQVAEELLELVAQQHLEAVERGDRAPLKAVAEYLQNVGIDASEDSVRRWKALSIKRKAYKRVADERRGPQGEEG